MDTHFRTMPGGMAAPNQAIGKMGREESAALAYVLNQLS
jgi:hypothetical protein